MHSRIRQVTGALALAGALLSSGTHARAQSSSSQEGLVGTWLIQVTLRNCDTNAPLGTFNSLVSFHRGGTLTESPGNTGFAAGQRTIGHGAWTHQGASTYSQKVIALLTFDTPANLPGTPTFDPSKPVSPGFFAGWQTITHTITADGDTTSSSGTNAFYRADGTLYRTGCSTAIGQRFQ